MKFLNKQGQEISLKRAENLPGYEVTLAEDTVIDSAVNNPFFKGINILQLPKKMKGFRNNKELQTLLKPQGLDTRLILNLSDNEVGFFEPNETLVSEKRLVLVNRMFGNHVRVEPLFINLGLKTVKITAGTVIGVIMVQPVVVD